MNRIGLGIVQGKEGTRQTFAVQAHALLGILQAGSQKIDLLVRRYRKFLPGSHFGIPRKNLRRPTVLGTGMILATSIFEFAKRRQQTGAVGLVLTVFATKTKLDRVPVTLLNKTTVVRQDDGILLTTRPRTRASLSTSSSDAPKLANPISCEKSAKSRSANMGAWPSNSWQMSGSGV